MSLSSGAVAFSSRWFPLCVRKLFKRCSSMCCDLNRENCNPTSSAKHSAFSGAWIPLVLLQRGFRRHEYGCDDDELDDEGSLVFLQISANRIWGPWRQSYRCKLRQRHNADGGCKHEWMRFVHTCVHAHVCVCACEVITPQAMKNLPKKEEVGEVEDVIWTHVIPN